MVNMPSSVTNYQTEECLRTILNIEGYRLSETLPPGGLGCDIIAKKGRKTIHIEVIGFKDQGPSRSLDFYQVFFRAISRIKDGAKHCVIAAPKRFGNGLQQRASQYGEAWERIGHSFPELEIWLVDVDTISYKETSWNSWLK